jgi:UDP-glucose 4-epimerase
MPFFLANLICISPAKPYRKCEWDVSSLVTRSTRSKIVVTGGAGFIGSHLAEGLLDRGFRVVVIDNFSAGRISNLDRCRGNKQLTVVRMDVRDPGIVRVLRGATTVYHLAASVGVQSSLDDPKKVTEVNVDGTLNLLMASKQNGVGRFVFASSAAVYGFSRSAVQEESKPPSPVTPYAISKLAAETYCKLFYESHFVDTVSLRFFNVYGPRQRPGSYAGVITSFVSRILAKKPPVIFGSGRQTRDFVFVSDVSQALLLSLEKDQVIGKTINIGTGRPTTINELARSIGNLFGQKRIPIIRKPAREGDILHSCADVTVARKYLDYRSRVKLKDGLRTTLGPLRQHARNKPA